MSSVTEYLPDGKSFPLNVLARALCVHRDHLIHLIECGELPAVDLRAPYSSKSCIRIPREAIEEFLRKRIVATVPRKSC
jgi:hypothetical protein